MAVLVMDANWGRSRKILQEVGTKMCTQTIHIRTWSELPHVMRSSLYPVDTAVLMIENLADVNAFRRWLNKGVRPTTLVAVTTKYRLAFVLSLCGIRAHLIRSKNDFSGLARRVHSRD